MDRTPAELDCPALVWREVRRPRLPGLVAVSHRSTGATVRTEVDDQARLRDRSDLTFRASSRRCVKRP